VADDTDGSTVVVTLEMKRRANLMSLDFYHYPSMVLMNRSEYEHQCEQAFVVGKDGTVIC
jgi:PHD/YefM family antitoxin component YafN of YafNO toxin-antitoxin module